MFVGIDVSEYRLRMLLPGFGSETDNGSCVDRERPCCSATEAKGMFPIITSTGTSRSNAGPEGSATT